MGRVTCGKNCFWDSGCQKSRTCACNVCGPLRSVNYQLYEGCIDRCQASPRPATTDEFLCSMDPDVLYNQYGMLACGYTLEDTAQYQAYQAEQANEMDLTPIFIGLFVLLSLLVISIIDV